MAVELNMAFAIRTYRGGRLCRTEAVTATAIEQVTRWMRDGTTTIPGEGATRQSRPIHPERGCCSTGPSGRYRLRRTHA